MGNKNSPLSGCCWMPFGRQGVKKGVVGLTRILGLRYTKRKKKGNKKIMVKNKITIRINMIPLKSKLTLKILGLYFNDERRRYYVNQIAKIVQDDPSNVYKKLVWMKKKTIFTDRFSGRERYFLFNQRCRFLDELREAVLKRINFSVEVVLKRYLSGARGIEKVFALNCASKKALEAKEELDLLLIGKIKQKAIDKLALRCESDLKKGLNLVCLSKKEFELKQKKANPFLKFLLSKPFLQIV